MRHIKEHSAVVVEEEFQLKKTFYLFQLQYEGIKIVFKIIVRMAAPIPILPILKYQILLSKYKY